METIYPLEGGANRRPSMIHRMSSAQRYEYPESPHRTRPAVVVPSVVSTSRGYVWYTVSRGHPDWEAMPLIDELRAPQSEIVQMVKKEKGGDGPVSKQLRSMHLLRREHIYRLITELDDQENGKAHWEPVLIKTKKKESNIVMKFDLVLARKFDTRARSPSKERSPKLENIEFREPFSPQGRQTKEPRDRDSYFERPRDPILHDPFGVKPVFSTQGRPMDERGPIEYGNAGLPPQIPRELPIGTAPKKDKGKKDKGDAEKLAFEMLDPDLQQMSGGLDNFHIDENLPEEIIEIKDDKRGRRSKSQIRGEPVEVIDMRRSHSRKRPKSNTRYIVTPNARSRSRSRSRSKSKRRTNRDDSRPIVILQDKPNPKSSRNRSSDRNRSMIIMKYPEGASPSSESGESRSGFSDYEERSSRTSSDTHRITRRGSLRYEGRDYMDVKEHRPGPKYMRRSRTYQEEPQVIMPERSRRRMSEARYRTIPESRALQIDYRPDDRDLARVSTRAQAGSPRYELPELLYPHEDRDSRRNTYRERDSERQIEDYQRQRIREDHFRQMERDIDNRERELAQREDDLRRRRDTRYRLDNGYYEEYR